MDKKYLIASVQIVVFRDMTSCSLVESYLTTKLYSVLTDTTKIFIIIAIQRHMKCS
jgi:hypothetical protein